MLSRHELEGMYQDTGGVRVRLLGELQEVLEETWGDEVLADQVELANGTPMGVIGSRRGLEVATEVAAWRVGQVLDLELEGGWKRFTVRDRARGDGGATTLLILAPAPNP